MKRAFITVFIILFAARALGQQNVLLDIKGYGADKTDRIEKHVVYTEDKGVILKIPSALGTGGNLPQCHNGVNFYANIFRKYDSLGSLSWERCYRPGAFQTDTATLFIFPASNADFYKIEIYGTGGTSGANVKYALSNEDQNQNTLWRGPGYGDINQLMLRAVSRLDDGGFLLGFQCLFVGGDVTAHYGSAAWLDIWLLKLDSLGNRIWSKTVGGSYDDVVQSVIPASGGGCYIAGGTASSDYDFVGSHGGGETFITKLDAHGDIKWSKLVGGSSDEWCYAACSDGRGGILVGGEAISKNGDVQDHLGPVGSVNAFLANVDSTGSVLWAKCYGTGGWIKAVTKSTEGSIWATGVSGIIGRHTDTAFGDGDAWVTRISDSGEFISSVVLGGPKEDEGTMVCTLPGDIAMVGGEYREAATTPGFFPTTYFGGVTDIFLAQVARWTTSIKEPFSVKYTVAPNPTTNKLVVQIKEESSEPFYLAITDQTGKEVFQKQLTNQAAISIDISSFLRGTYVLTIKQPGKGSVSEKIIIQ